MYIILMAMYIYTYSVQCEKVLCVHAMISSVVETISGGGGDHSGAGERAVQGAGF